MSRKRDGGTDGGKRRTVAESGRDHLRAAVGGLFVGLPLLWTMEMWTLGSTLSPGHLLVLLALAFALVAGFNAVSGFRRDRSVVEIVIDAVESTGVSIVVAAVMLFLLGRLGPELGLATAVGRVALLSIPVAFGSALATTVLGDQEDGGGRASVGSLGRLFVAAGGALYFALNVAPTDEVRRLGSEADVPLLLLVIVASLLISLAIVFIVELPGGRSVLGSGRPGQGPLENPIGETVAAYAIAVLVSALLIVALGQSDGLGLRAFVGYVVMLATVASFGSAAGRLLIGGEPAAGDRAA